MASNKGRRKVQQLINIVDLYNWTNSETDRQANKHVALCTTEYYYV